MSHYARLASLPVEISGYELSAHDLELGSFTRGSTVVELSGAGETGLGEDVVYDVLDHIAHRDAGPVHDFTGVTTLGEFCELVGGLDLFGGTPPLMEASAHYRRWAYESSALDLALRQAGIPLHEALGIDPKPLKFICSTRLSGVPDPAGRVASNLEPITKRLERYPGLRFKLDPENDWTPELIEELKGLAGVDVLDMKGHYKDTPVDVETDPELYARSIAAFPEAWIEDADLTPETREVLAGHEDRLTWDAPMHSLEDVKALEREPQAINSKPSRWGSIEELLKVYAHCEQRGIEIYSGGQSEVSVGRGQVQYLSSLFHPDSTNDIAPSGYNDPSVPAGLPSPPMDPVPSAVGFRWGE